MVQVTQVGRVLGIYTAVHFSKTPLGPHIHFSDTLFKICHLKFFMETSILIQIVKYF